jgi:hypothetical protein
VKRATFLATLLLAAVFPATAFAAPRVPQVPVNNASQLPTFFTTNDAGVVVDDDGGAGTQDATNSWRASVGNTIVTLMLEATGLADGNSVGLYNTFDGTRFEIFNGLADEGAYAVVTISGTQLSITRTNADLTPGPNTLVGGIDPTGFGFYIQKGANEQTDFGYTDDSRNPGDVPRVLAYPGTDNNAGAWWLCFEDGRDAGQANAEDDDFDDAVLVLRTVTPSPVSKTTWSSLKARFR